MDFALNDLDDGEILFRENRFNNACYLAQQTTEKALKGFLVDNNISYPKRHDLDVLNKLCADVDATFTRFETKLAFVTQFYAPVRYPDAAIGMASGGMPTKDMAREALDYAHEVVDFCCEKIRQVIQQKPPEPLPR